MAQSHNSCNTENNNSSGANNNASNASATTTVCNPQQPSPLSLGPISSPSSLPSHQRCHPRSNSTAADHSGQPRAVPLTAVHPGTGSGAAEAFLARIRLSDISPYEGAPSGPYLKAVEALSGSLMRHNAAVLELGADDAATMLCGLESTRFYFRSRAQGGTGGIVANWNRAGSAGSRGVYMYRAGRALEDSNLSPPCMGEIFKCMGKAARAALCAIARHLRLCSYVFNHLLDDTPLPANEASSSVLVASYFDHVAPQSGKGAVGDGKPSINGEVEKGLLTLISSDSPGIQVCDPNGRWYIADSGLGPGCFMLLTGKALSHATAGLRPAASYRSSFDLSAGATASGRTSLAFRLMPQTNAILDCSPISAAGHVIPQSYVPITVSQFMDDLSAEEDMYCSHFENCHIETDTNKGPSLRSLLSDHLSGAFLEDAMVVSCGHSFGGLMLKKIAQASRCTLCDSEIQSRPLIPNHALRAAAAAVKTEDERRLFHYTALRKRRRETGDLADSAKRVSRENGDITADGALHRGVQYPFSVHEKVIIKGNRRTPDKFVGKEAIITSQCLNGWYQLQIIGTGESVRLQYRSLHKLSGSHLSDGNRCGLDSIRDSS